MSGPRAGAVGQRLRPLVVPGRFRGPPGSANGGYVCGRLAGYFATGGQPRPVQVTLRQPPPLDAAMTVLTTVDGLALRFGGVVIAEAVAVAPDDFAVEPIDPVGFDEASRLMAGYAGLELHPFPGCVVCGVDRPPPDGLGLRPGPVPGRPATLASAWVPGASFAEDGEVPEEVAWAALDCPGGWSAGLAGRPLVLGRMTARVDVLPRVGDRCVVMGHSTGLQGRKAFSTTTLYDGDGRVLGRGAATWISIDLARVGRR